MLAQPSKAVYWITWELNFDDEDVQVDDGRVIVTGRQPWTSSVEAGWTKVDADRPCPTFTHVQHGGTALRAWMPVTKPPSSDGNKISIGFRLISTSHETAWSTIVVTTDFRASVKESL